VAEPHVDQALASAVEQGADERLEDAGAGAPRDVEPRHGVAVPVGEVAAALGPLHEREPAHALGVQPRPQVARGELDEALRPRATPAVRAVVGEVGGPEPVGEGQLRGVLHPEAALLGGVDEEQPAERPERLTAQARGGLGVEQGDPAAGGEQLGGGDEPGEARADDHDIGVRHGATLRSVR
jgi:hypothetical protein